MNSRTTIVTACLAVSGAAMATFAGSRLAQDGQFDFQPNPLGLMRSPYGQVIAMAIQSPIDKDWHGGLEIHGMPDASGHVHDEHCDHDHADEHEHDACSCGHDHDAVETNSPLLVRLDHATAERTNPNAPTEAHKFYLRAQIEKKLRFAYNLDPSHYANYNSYHLFLTQMDLGTIAVSATERRDLVIGLADRTIRYCLTEQSDPRPSLTAASAAYNIVEQMFTAEEGTYTSAQMRDQLEVMDFCLHRHFKLLDEATTSGSWALLSPQRQDEVLKRSTLLMKLRDAALGSLARKEPEHVSNS